MVKYATWEGANVMLVRAKGRKLETKPFTGGKEAMLEESYDHPVGVIIRNLYDAKWKS